MQRTAVTAVTLLMKTKSGEFFLPSTIYLLNIIAHSIWHQKRPNRIVEPRMVTAK